MKRFEEPGSRLRIAACAAGVIVALTACE